MKQSSNKKSREATAFLYERLSRDDNLEGESYSIGNQKKLLTKVAKEKGYTNLVHFLDDGISGVTMNRPGFVEMMQQLEQGKAAAVFVKDLSRLGRNYIEVGRLTEEFFPDHDIRLVAVSDNIDTAEGENELAPIRNLFNEWYARDISKKRRISNKIKGNSGEPMGLPPYGYIKDPNNPKHWVIDEEAAQVVRRIFDMTLEGFGTEQIATQFEKEGILTPQAYWIQKGIGRPGKTKTRPATKWNGSTITHLLYQQEYCGDVLNFKTYSKSHKLKKRLQNAPENYRIFPDTQPAIINEKVWERVQELRANKRRPAKQAERQGLFSGLLYCADCGSKLHFATGKNMTPEQDCYRFARYKSNTGDCTMHFIREETLKRFVLRRIFDVTAMFFEDIMSFQKTVYEQRFEEAERAAKKRKREIAQAEKRIAELDRIFKRIYEDDISGAISHERFLKLSAEYEAEQKELTEKVKTDREMVNAYEQDKADFDSFAAVIRKYVGITELTPTIVNEFVKKIIVHAPDKSSGHRRQKIQIIWNFVGELKQDEDKQTIERQRKSRTA